MFQVIKIGTKGHERRCTLLNIKFGQSEHSAVAIKENDDGVELKSVRIVRTFLTTKSRTDGKASTGNLITCTTTWNVLSLVRRLPSFVSLVLEMKGSSYSILLPRLLVGLAVEFVGYKFKLFDFWHKCLALRIFLTHILWYQHFLSVVLLDIPLHKKKS